MNDYIEQFKAAERASLLRYGHEVSPQLTFRAEKAPYGREVVDAIVADFLDGVVKSAQGMIGNCFCMVREASYVLFEAGIDHALTIGNVAINGELRFTTTAESLLQEMLIGYVPTEPANAHAWLTLDTGQIVDLTVIPSYAHHRGEEVPAVEQAIYLSGQAITQSVEHIPYMTGFAYHLTVVTHPWAPDGSFERYARWLRDVEVFRRRIGKQPG